MCLINEQWDELLGSNTCHQNLKVQLEAGNTWYTQWANTGTILFKIFINGLDDGTECTLSKFANYTRLGRVADTPKGYAVVQRDLKRLEKWADTDLMKLSRGKGQVSHLGGKNPMDKYREQISGEGPWWTASWTWARHVSLQKSKSTASCTALVGLSPAGWRRWSFPSIQH